MSLTTTQEHQLIVDAQAGDGLAKIQLLDEYRYNIEALVNKVFPSTREDNPAYGRDDYQADLTNHFLETINLFDTSGSNRLWPYFIRSGAPEAMHRLSRLSSSFDVSDRTSDRVRAVDRRITEGADLNEALAAEHLHVQTYREVHDILAGRQVSDYENEPERDREQSVAEAEVALDSMTAVQRDLARIKFGFTDEVPTSVFTRGWPDEEVAQKYSARVLGDERAEAGDSAISRATVNREIRSGLNTAREAIRTYRQGE